MDTRTYLEMIAVGHEQEAKLRAAAAARQAKEARQRRRPQTRNQTRSRWLVGLRVSTGGLALWRKLKGVVVGV